MHNNLPTQPRTPVNIPTIYMDTLFKQFHKSEYKVTAEYDQNGNLVKISGELSPGKKTRWDWFQLFIVPVLLVLISASLGILQFLLSNNLAQQQHDSDQRVAQQQRAVDQTISHETQQQVILKTYLDDMSNLLLSTGIATPQLLLATTNDEVRKVAQAKTQIALESLDAKYKADVMTFLYEADLVNWHNFDLTSHKSALPLVKLDFDNLQGLDMRGVFMDNADIHDTFLNGAKMSDSILAYNNFSISIMQKVDLSRSSLHGSDLHGSDLTGATLNDTLLNCNQIAVNPNVFDYKALLPCPDLQGVNFTNAIMKHVHLQGTDLSSANFTNANLSGAFLNCSSPQNGLYCVKLRGAILDGADFSGARPTRGRC